jgi:hypothetical protein
MEQLVDNGTHEPLGRLVVSWPNSYLGLVEVGLSVVLARTRIDLDAPIVGTNFDPARKGA